MVFLLVALSAIKVETGDPPTGQSNNSRSELPDGQEIDALPLSKETGSVNMTGGETNG